MTLWFKKQKKTAVKSISDYRMQMLIKQGRDQFKKLMDKGLGVPVALL